MRKFVVGRDRTLNFAGLFAALAMIVMGFGAPAHAQDVETFDPDDAFGAPAPQGTTQADPDFGAPDFGTPRGAPTSVPDTAPPFPEPRNPSQVLPDVAVPVAGPVASQDQAQEIIRQPGFRTAPSLDPVTGQTAPADSPSRPGSSIAGPTGGDFTSEFPAYDGQTPTPPGGPNWVPNDQQYAQAPAEAAPAAAAQDASTYGQDDLIGAAEGVFGKGAQGLAKMIEDLLRDQGEPNGYIVGREAGGAFVVGARYGSGTLHHKVEGQRKVYWTGPSVGLDAGANAANTFVLVYNLYDSEELFRRYPAGEGQAYLIGGLHASYMRRDDVVLIPIRLGAGLRLGINAGYMRFSKKQRWLPF